MLTSSTNQYFNPQWLAKLFYCPEKGQQWLRPSNIFIWRKNAAEDLMWHTSLKFKQHCHQKRLISSQLLYHNQVQASSYIKSWQGLPVLRHEWLTNNKCNNNSILTQNYWLHQQIKFFYKEFSLTVLQNFAKY